MQHRLMMPTAGPFGGGMSVVLLGTAALVHATISDEPSDRPQPSNTCYFTASPIPSGWVITSVRLIEIMEYGEAWLLETLALNRLPVHCMLRPERPMREWLNHGYHGLSPERLISTLTSMFDRGEIDAYHDHDFKQPATLQEFLLALGGKHTSMHCGVTQLGGKRWEALANPDWSRYFEDSGWDGEHVEITAATRERLIELVENAKVLWRCRMTLADRSIEWFAPWEPLAWKTLPSGYRANVRYESLPYTPQSRDDFIREHREIWPREVELRTWAKRLCGGAWV